MMKATQLKELKSYLSKKKINDVTNEGKLKVSDEVSEKLEEIKATLQDIKKLYE